MSLFKYSSDSLMTHISVVLCSVSMHSILQPILSVVRVHISRQYSFHYCRDTRPIPAVSTVQSQINMNIIFIVPKSQYWLRYCSHILPNSALSESVRIYYFRLILSYSFESSIHNWTQYWLDQWFLRYLPRIELCLWYEFVLFNCNCGFVIYLHRFWLRWDAERISVRYTIHFCDELCWRD